MASRGHAARLDPQLLLKMLSVQKCLPRCKKHTDVPSEQKFFAPRHEGGGEQFSATKYATDSRELREKHLLCLKGFFFHNDHFYT